MDKLEWRSIEDIDDNGEWRLAFVEAMRKIAEELHQMNNQIDILLKSGVPDKDPD